MKKKLLIRIIALAVFMGTASLSFAKQVLPSAHLTTDNVVNHFHKDVSLYAATPVNRDPCVPVSCKPPQE